MKSNIPFSNSYLSLADLCAERIVFLDGAFGTMVQRLHLTEKDFRDDMFQNHPVELTGNNDVLCLTAPQHIRDIHTAYLEAGADIIETNTFSATRIGQAEYGLQDRAYDIAFAGARVAREAVNSFCEKNGRNVSSCFVAGSMGPTSKTASMSPDVSDPAARAVTFSELVENYQEQARGLLDGGADILLVETVFDTLNCKAALLAIMNECEKRGSLFPVMVSGTITDSSGRLLAGQTAKAFWHSLSSYPVFSIGFNCALGAREMGAHLRDIQNAYVRVSVHPNAGLPNEFGGYNETPEEMAEILQEFASEKLMNIVGGCCGTTPETIRAIAGKLTGISPREVPENKHHLLLSGLDGMEVSRESRFVNIGERMNIAGSLKFARLIREKKYAEAVAIGIEQAENGAQVIDVNLDDGMIDTKEEMIHFLNLIMSEPAIARVPLMIDSSRFEVLLAGMECVQGKGIVNSVSLKEGESIFLERARKVRERGFALVCMAFDEQGQADTLARRIQVCERMYRLLRDKLDFPAEDILFDPNILTIGTGMAEHANYGIDFIETCRYIRENLPHAHVVGGVSNLSFAFRGNNAIRESIHSCFLYHAGKAGMDFGIVNAGVLPAYESIPEEERTLIEDLIFNRNPNATDKLLTYAQSVKDRGVVNNNNADALAWRKELPEERIMYAMIKGIDRYIEDDVRELIPKYEKAVQIIEGPLMNAMNRVGELFGEGKLFLPQVVKSARMMKLAVSVLLPYIEAEKSGENFKAGKIIMATVKGDVHDIGKNIVSVVLACNHYEVVDLGVMVPCEKIVEAMKEHKPDMVGLSGLITPSLDEMVTVAKAFKREGLKTPLIIGGAAASAVHTAVKIAPESDAPVIYASDAGQGATLIEQWMNPSKRAEFVRNLQERQEFLRAEHAKRHGEQVKLTSLEEARAHGENHFNGCDCGCSH
ncbi:MAG: methionine synthase [Fibrobacter sp.]|nr:methionine synthase [Fibrobacter sp.]